MTQKRNHTPNKTIFRVSMIFLEMISLLDEHILYQGMSKEIFMVI